jgi:hypothetical protein
MSIPPSISLLKTAKIENALYTQFGFDRFKKQEFTFDE